MRRPRWWALGALLGGLAVATATAQPQRPQKQTTLKGRIATRSRMREEQVDQVLRAIGPSLAEMLQSGQSVEVPGLGTFRVVQVPEHRDLVGGRPSTIAASNYVEFLASSNLVGAANSAGASPAVTVPPFQYNPLPAQTPSLHVPNNRAPARRTR